MTRRTIQSEERAKRVVRTSMFDAVKVKTAFTGLFNSLQNKPLHFYSNSTLTLNIHLSFGSQTRLWDKQLGNITLYRS